MNSQCPKRRHIRLPDFDYSQAGAYCVTICSRNKKCIFGDIVEAEMRLNKLGVLVIACWNELASTYPVVELDYWVLMPNHLHGIVWLQEENFYRKSLSGVIGAFKSISTSRANNVFNRRESLWQRGFFEHIIRDENDLFRIRQYISDNPTQWVVDSENPDFVNTTLL